MVTFIWCILTKYTNNWHCVVNNRQSSHQILYKNLIIYYNNGISR